MGKKTPSPTRGQPKVREDQNSGLIAKAEGPRQSARAKSVLDNRSHRTRVPSSRWERPAPEFLSFSVSVPTWRITW